MNFTSPSTLLALAIAAMISFLVPARWRCIYLLALSYLFYFTWSVRDSLLLVGSTIVIYTSALIIDRAKAELTRKLAVALSISALLLVLIFFKYSIVLASISEAVGARSLTAIFSAVLIPIGISYYLFKSISYVLDVYWDNIKAQRDPIALGLYVSFFPQILSGPIQRAPEFFEQVRSPDFGRPTQATFQRAIGTLLLGFFEKLVVADHIGALVAAIDASKTQHAGMLLMGTYGYALQLFADFSGVTHIAIGMGLLFGIEGPPNFNRPFRANNIQEYWRGWHMSLTTWLTDYLFMPLRMALRNFGNAGLAMSIMINMVLIGVWHGANWTFLVFGVIHGCFMIGSALTLKSRNVFFKSHPALAQLRKVYAPIVTFHMVCFALVFFRAPSVTSALDVLRGIANLQFAQAAAPSIGFDILAPALLAAVIAFELGTGYLRTEKFCQKLLSSDGASLARWATYGVATLAIILLATTSGGEFIYARF